MGKKSASGPTRKDRRIAELEAEIARLRSALGEAEHSVGQLTRAAEYAQSFSRAIACEAAHMRHQNGVQASIISLAGRIHEVAEHALPDPHDDDDWNPPLSDIRDKPLQEGIAMPKLLAVFIHRATGERVELNTQIAVDRFFDNRKPEDWKKA